MNQCKVVLSINIVDMLFCDDIPLFKVKGGNKKVAVVFNLLLYYLPKPFTSYRGISLYLIVIVRLVFDVHSLI